MQETLYKTRTPQRFLSEYYEIAVLPRRGSDPGYMFIEHHGWWSEDDKEPKNNYVTICPEEGLTYEAASQMYEIQRNHRASEGFVYSFSQDPFGGSGPRVIEV
jgi:hypothetical protein